MRLETVGDVIAIRKLQVLGEPGRKVHVKLGKPQPSPDSPDIECYRPFQITGAGDERVRYAAGVDAFQAIKLTFRLIASSLSRINRDLDGKLRWDFDNGGGLGFAES